MKWGTIGVLIALLIAFVVVITIAGAILLPEPVRQEILADVRGLLSLENTAEPPQQNGDSVGKIYIEIQATATRTLIPTPTLRPTDTKAAIQPTETPVQPTSTPTPIIESQLLVTANAANVRAGPGTNYAIINLVMRYEILGVLATDSTKGWYNIILAGDQRGWIGSSVVEIINLAEELEVAITIPAPP